MSYWCSHVKWNDKNKKNKNKYERNGTSNYYCNNKLQWLAFLNSLVRLSVFPGLQHRNGGKLLDIEKLRTLA